ncbi:MAG: sigma-70 family RNA polymerase sigma factor [Planctomycetes bacterium]|nr:sigma-70 family RNA polymerase sigma factor [Planctomycetota bacterium]
MAAPIDVTQHLDALARGDRTAVDRLFPVIYGDLRALAADFFRGRGPQTLEPTALVHEAYARLVGRDHDLDGWTGRRHFYSVAALAMRQILVDHARARGAQRRGGDRQRVVLDESDLPATLTAGVDPLELDEALTELARLDPRQARIAELRFLTGLSVAETADVLGVSERTVKLDWRMARAWLRDALQGGSSG